MMSTILSVARTLFLIPAIWVFVGQIQLLTTGNPGEYFAFSATVFAITTTIVGMSLGMASQLEDGEARNEMRVIAEFGFHGTVLFILASGMHGVSFALSHDPSLAMAWIPETARKYLGLTFMFAGSLPLGVGIGKLFIAIDRLINWFSERPYNQRSPRKSSQD